MHVVLDAVEAIEGAVLEEAPHLAVEDGVGSLSASGHRPGVLVAEIAMRRIGPLLATASLLAVPALAHAGADHRRAGTFGIGLAGGTNTRGVSTRQWMGDSPPLPLVASRYGRWGDGPGLGVNADHVLEMPSITEGGAGRRRLEPGRRRRGRAGSGERHRPHPLVLLTDSPAAVRAALPRAGHRGGPMLSLVLAITVAAAAPVRMEVQDPTGTLHVVEAEPPFEETVSIELGKHVHVLRLATADTGTVDAVLSAGRPGKLKPVGDTSLDVPSPGNASSGRLNTANPKGSPVGGATAAWTIRIFGPFPDLSEGVARLTTDWAPVAPASDAPTLARLVGGAALFAAAADTDPVGRWPGDPEHTNSDLGVRILEEVGGRVRVVREAEFTRCGGTRVHPSVRLDAWVAPPDLRHVTSDDTTISWADHTAVHLPAGTPVVVDAAGVIAGFQNGADAFTLPGDPVTPPPQAADRVLARTRPDRSHELNVLKVPVRLADAPLGSTGTTNAIIGRDDPTDLTLLVPLGSCAQLLVRGGPQGRSAGPQGGVGGILRKKEPSATTPRERIPGDRTGPLTWPDGRPAGTLAPIADRNPVDVRLEQVEDLADGRRCGDWRPSRFTAAEPLRICWTPD